MLPVSTIVTGMVLSAMPVGDYDKRLVILTKERGKISAFAKGARKQNSALLACSQPFSFGEFSLYTGRSSYNIVSAEISNYFGELREDFDSLCYGFYFCEFADYLTKENNDEKEILKLLYQTFRVLIKKSIDVRLVRAIFELKIMTLNGEAPQVFSCVKCEKPFGNTKQEESKAYQAKYFFSAERGGILCDTCKVYNNDAIQINISTVYTLQYIISKNIEKLYTFRVTEDVLYELQRCMKHYLNCYAEHEFKSLEMMKGI